ncbi:MAG: acyl-CoA thioesterase [Chitinophagales bacterium]|jgi:acyl-CoA thioester hydrolase|nr:acyl-CoA thioesterase [Chitinophagales bacterium]
MRYRYKHTVRVAYADTDQMGVVYYGNYARFFEVARTEALRSLGIRYADLERAGVMLPVTRMHVKYIRPALYDDLLTIEVIIPTIPDRMITFEYVLFNEKGEKLVEAETQLMFMDATSRKLIHAPESVVSSFKEVK